MPYIIRFVDNGYKLCLKRDENKCFSNHPIPYENAVKQRKAIAISEHKGSGKTDLKKLANLIKKEVSGLYIVGSIARKQTPNDIDFITLKNLKKVEQELFNYFDVPRFQVEVLKDGDKHISLKVDDSFQIDVWKAENKNYLKYMKINRSIDKGHNIAYRKKARELGFKLNDNGLFDGDIQIPYKNEKELRFKLNIS
jgi:DNA polymerase/3'-5' exonuclease PolX